MFYTKLGKNSNKTKNQIFGLFNYFKTCTLHSLVHFLNFGMQKIQLPKMSQYGDYLGDNCIQNFHLGRYIVGYTVGNLVLRRRASGAVKLDF